MRVCNMYLLLLCLHGMSAYMAGAWQHGEGCIVRQLLLPELAFWQTVTHKDSKAAFDPGGGGGVKSLLPVVHPLIDIVKGDCCNHRTISDAIQSSCCLHFKSW